MKSSLQSADRILNPGRAHAQCLTESELGGDNYFDGRGVEFSELPQGERGAYFATPTEGLWRLGAGSVWCRGGGIR